MAARPEEEEEEQGALLADTGDAPAASGQEGAELQTVKLDEIPPVVRTFFSPLRERCRGKHEIVGNVCGLQIMSTRRFRFV